MHHNRRCGFASAQMRILERMGALQQHMELGTQRDAPPHFAGRSMELAALNRRLDALCISASAEAGISLVTGVQGVGKTHLGLKFARDATKREGARRVFWKSMLPDTLAADDAVVFMAIMRALGSESIGRKVAGLAAGGATAEDWMTRRSEVVRPQAAQPSELPRYFPHSSVGET